MSEGKVDEFMAITGADDAAIATQFIEMADGNLNTAISLFFENGGAALLSVTTHLLRLIRLLWHPPL